MAEQEEERKIPVFTVLKNGAIMKNIFVINNPESISPGKDIGVGDQEMEETLMIGRHPDCNIMLTHPSISRFHLQIHSNPSRQRLSVSDLSSVHGTWVSDEKIKPGVRVEVKEGDTIRIGGSTRIYRLHWIPFSRAYDMDASFVVPMDMSVGKKQEESDAMLEAENALEAPEIIEEEKPVLDDEVPTLDKMLEGLDSLFSCENSERVVKKEIPSAPLKPTNNSLCEERDDGRSGKAALVKDVLNGKRAMMETQTQQLEEDSQVIPELAIDIVSEEKNLESYSSKQASCGPLVTLDCFSLVGKSVAKEADNHDLSNEQAGHAEDILRQVMTVSSSLPEDEHFSEIKPKQNHKPHFGQTLSDREDKGNPSKFKKANSAVKADTEEIFEEAKDLSLSGSPEQSGQRSFVAAPVSPDESVNSSPTAEEVFCAMTDDKENRNPQSQAVACIQTENNSQSPQLKSAERLSTHDTGSKRGKSEFVLNIQTSSSKRKTLTIVDDTEAAMQNEAVLNDKSILNANSEKLEPEIFAPDKENLTLSPLIPKRFQEISEMKGNASFLKVEHRPSSLKIPFSHNIQLVENIIAASENLESEIFTPDKENLTPNSHALKRLQDIGKLEENRTSSKSGCRPFSSKVAFSYSTQSQENIFAASEKEYQTPGILQEREWKPAIGGSRSQVKMEQEAAVTSERKIQRVPFQPSLEKSPANSRLFTGAPSAAARSRSSVNRLLKIEKRVSHPSSIDSARKSKMRWTIVVDTTSLLNKDSRKWLQLLQGLKGTQLVIPRTVLRELDCLKRHGSLFRRTAEVSLVLGWIEECMIKTKWWIHVQSSSEEADPVAPTPPASPQSVFSAEATSNSTFPFSVCKKNSIDMVSPTPEDHILDYALLYRKKHNDGQFVLLSKDVTLKIKAMAEGLICETASEFYESLVNPFSERFLWAESSPRGQTWSHLDDVVLRERYNNRSFVSKKPTKGEGVKGLKLILLHNAHYGQNTIFC